MTGLELTLPVILSVVSAGASVAGAVQSAAAAEAQAEAEAQAAGYNSAVALRNKELLGQTRARIARQSQVDIEDARRRNAREMSESRARFGMSGLAGGGSIAEVLADRAVALRLDTKRIRYTADVAIRNTTLAGVQAQDVENQ